MYKHRLKQFVYEGGVKRPKIVHINSYYGSDVLDKHGNEIFEGDRVRYELNGAIEQGTIRFEEASFWHVSDHSQGLLPLSEFNDGELEVIGHVED